MNKEIEENNCLNTANERIKWCTKIMTRNEEECHIFEAFTEYISFMQNCDSDNVIEISLIRKITKAIEKLGDKQKEQTKLKIR